MRHRIPKTFPVRPQQAQTIKNLFDGLANLNRSAMFLLYRLSLSPRNLALVDRLHELAVQMNLRVQLLVQFLTTAREQKPTKIYVHFRCLEENLEHDGRLDEAIKDECELIDFPHPHPSYEAELQQLLELICQILDRFAIPIMPGTLSARALAGLLRLTTAIRRQTRCLVNTEVNKPPEIVVDFQKTEDVN
jgi:hypothetical protein